MFQGFGKVIRGGFLVALLGLGACSELGWNPLDPDYIPPEQDVTLPTPAALAFDLPTLGTLTPVYKATVLADPLRADRRQSWSGDETTEPQASIMVRYSMDETPLAIPVDPKDAIAYWPALSWRSLDSQTLYETRNALGPVLWRRFVMGPFTCVILQQTVQNKLLAGYYCSPAGEELSEGQAETVAQSVRFEDSTPADQPAS